MFNSCSGPLSAPFQTIQVEKTNRDLPAVVAERLKHKGTNLEAEFNLKK